MGYSRFCYSLPFISLTYVCMYHHACPHVYHQGSVMSPDGVMPLPDFKELAKKPRKKERQKKATEVMKLSTSSHDQSVLCCLFRCLRDIFIFAPAVLFLGATPCALRPSVLLLKHLHCRRTVLRSLVNRTEYEKSLRHFFFAANLVAACAHRWKRPARWSAATWRSSRNCWSWTRRRIARITSLLPNREN